MPREDIVAAVHGHSARATAFRRQVEIEVALLRGEVEAARQELAALEDEAFLDVAWIDRCPLLDPLRESTELRALRRATAARAAKALRALDGEDTPSAL